MLQWTYQKYRTECEKIWSILLTSGISVIVYSKADRVDVSRSSPTAGRMTQLVAGGRQLKTINSNCWTRLVGGGDDCVVIGTDAECENPAVVGNSPFVPTTAGCVLDLNKVGSTLVLP